MDRGHRPGAEQAVNPVALGQHGTDDRHRAETRRVAADSLHDDGPGRRHTLRSER